MSIQARCNRTTPDSATVSVGLVVLRTYMDVTKPARGNRITTSGFFRRTSCESSVEPTLVVQFDLHSANITESATQAGNYAARACSLVFLHRPLHLSRRV